MITQLNKDNTTLTFRLNNKDVMIMKYADRINLFVDAVEARDLQSFAKIIEKNNADNCDCIVRKWCLTCSKWACGFCKSDDDQIVSRCIKCKEYKNG